MKSQVNPQILKTLILLPFVVLMVLAEHWDVAAAAVAVWIYFIWEIQRG